ncbi:MAG: DDE-type integrase/transposase/recombinase [Aestuariibacter sp.]|nr:DDE-type integrase/transposase/recombinase [Aestuariibacter sp.]
MDEVFIKINGSQHYFWRAVDQESLPRERSECFGYNNTLEILVQAKRNKRAALK